MRRIFPFFTVLSYYFDGLSPYTFAFYKRILYLGTSSLVLTSTVKSIYILFPVL
jgi:hypothetical protein